MSNLIHYLAHGQVAQSVRPSSIASHQLGAGTGCTHAVTNGNAVASDPAPYDGLVMIHIPPDVTGVAGTDAATCEIGPGVTATANSFTLTPGEHVRPIKTGEVVSLFADGTGFTAKIAMAR